MCILFFALKSHPEFPLVILSNRDEFYQRETRSAHFWTDYPDLLAGLDVQAGGTWLGVTRAGKFAAVTNYREKPTPPQDYLSRGALVADYLKGQQTPQEYATKVQQQAIRYQGFNLILGSREDCYYVSNRNEQMLCLKDGIYALSNHLLDTAWPKVSWGKQLFRQRLRQNHPNHHQDLMEILQRREYFPDAELPDTGVGLELERVLSPLYVQTPIYGTRASTLVWSDAAGKIVFQEYTHASGQWGQEVKTYVLNE